MAVYRIDLNLHGPFASIGEMQRAIRRYSDTRILYMALHHKLAAFAKGRNLTGQSVRKAMIAEKCEVAYVGVTQQQDLANRFYEHHKMVQEVRDKGLPALNRFWIGFLLRNAPDGTSGRKLETRLTIAEKMMIAWFLPPLNDEHVDREDGREQGKDMTHSAALHFVWWNADEQARAHGLPGFPASLHYNIGNEEITAIY